MIRRHITPRLRDALADSPVVLLNGARQTGKSTLAQQVAATDHPARYVTLDDATLLAAAQDDPAGFLGGLDKPVILDEVQRAPDLFMAIKADVDRHREPGRYLLTGSADVMLLPQLAESLVGRMELLTLWPFSQGELDATEERFVDALFSVSPPPSTEPADRADLMRRVLTGGYPEAVARSSADRRGAWLDGYVTTITQRDVRDLANIDRLAAIPRLLALLASRATGLLNYAALARDLGLPQSTLKRYMALLEATFLYQPLPAWSANLGKRLVKSPKILLNDTGLIAHLVGATPERLSSEPPLIGSLLESFAAVEIKKQIGWSRTRPQLYHFRTQTGQEVDLLLEAPSGQVVGVEVKATSTVSKRHFQGLRALQDRLGDRFARGVVLYTGREAVPFGKRLHAWPISALWQTGGSPSTRSD